VTLSPRHNDLIDEVESLRRRVRRLETRTRTATITKSFVVVGDFDASLYIPPIFVAPDPESVGDQGLDLRGVFAFIRAGSVNYQITRTTVTGQGSGFSGTTIAYGGDEFVGVGQIIAGEQPGAWTGTASDLRFGERFFLDVTAAEGASDMTVSLIFDHTPH
jgi:hypothetical protein